MLSLTFVRTLMCSMIALFLSSATTPTGGVKKKDARMYISHFENVLGTSMELKVSTFSEEGASQAETAVLNEISRLQKILSAYDPQSEFSQWFKTSGTPVKVSTELLQVLRLFDQWRQRSHGALDASAEVIGKLWKKTAAESRTPTQQELDKAVNEVKQEHWKLDEPAQTATHLSTAPLMLNSFVKSYIIEHAALAGMHAAKLQAIIVNIGGDIVISGDHSELVQLSDPKADAENDAPMDEVRIGNKAIATSGNYRRGELINGHWYSHIVDPRTGIPSDDILSATVIADNATDAGALATAFNVMTPQESVKLAETVHGAEYLIITRKGERIESKGWKNFEVAKKSTVNLPNSNFELTVNLEIRLQGQQSVKRPYVAVWIEDSTHAAIRTITLWHERDKYLSELKSWYLKYRGLYTSDRSALSSVSSATRSPGKYSVKWDGKDDKGNIVPDGKYTVKIEVSREHGTYQLMRQEMIFNDQPKLINLEGNVEIASASLDYHKKQ